MENAGGDYRHNDLREILFCEMSEWLLAFSHYSQGRIFMLKFGTAGYNIAQVSRYGKRNPCELYNKASPRSKIQLF